MVNQCIAAAVHMAEGEGIHPLLQNGMLMLMLATVALLCRTGSGTKADRNGAAPADAQPGQAGQPR